MAAANPLRLSRGPVACVGKQRKHLTGDQKERRDDDQTPRRPCGPRDETQIKTPARNGDLDNADLREQRLDAQALLSRPLACLQGIIERINIGRGLDANTEA